MAAAASRPVRRAAHRETRGSLALRPARTLGRGGAGTGTGAAWLNAGANENKSEGVVLWRDELHGGFPANRPRAPPGQKPNLPSTTAPDVFPSPRTPARAPFACSIDRYVSLMQGGPLWIVTAALPRGSGRVAGMNRLGQEVSTL